MEPATVATQEDNPKALLDRASDLLDTDPQQALAVLAPFETLNPEHSLLANAYFLRGCALQELGQHRKAVEAFENAQVDFPPELNGPGFFLREAISLNELMEPQKALDALAHVEQTPEPFPKESIARGIFFLQQGIALLGVGKAKLALDALRTASTLVQPGMTASSCWLQMGLALSTLGEFDEALQAFDRSRAEAPGDGGATVRILAAYQKANVLNRLQQNDKALEALESALDELQKTHPPGVAAYL